MLKVDNQAASGVDIEEAICTPINGSITSIPPARRDTSFGDLQSELYRYLPLPIIRLLSFSPLRITPHQNSPNLRAMAPYFLHFLVLSSSFVAVVSSYDLAPRKNGSKNQTSPHDPWHDTLRSIMLPNSEVCHMVTSDSVKAVLKGKGSALMAYFFSDRKGKMSMSCPLLASLFRES